MTRPASTSNRAVIFDLQDCLFSLASYPCSSPFKAVIVLFTLLKGNRPKISLYFGFPPSYYKLVELRGLEPPTS